MLDHMRTWTAIFNLYISYWVRGILLADDVTNFIDLGVSSTVFSVTCSQARVSRISD